MGVFTTSDGHRLHFSDSGSGRAVLCLAGLTRNSRDFAFLAPHMTGHRMIAMDYRGRGLSDFDADYANYNVSREMLDAVELLDHLGLDKVTVLGTSRGGLIAMAMAAAVPHRLAGVILNDVGPVVSQDGIARIIDYVGRRPGFSDYDAAAQGLAEYGAKQFPGVTLERWRDQAEAQYFETPGGLDLRYDPMLRQTLLDQVASGVLADLWPMFEALKAVPTGLLRGANSDILDPETATEMRRRHPDMIFAEVPDRGHVPFLDEPQSLALIARVLELAA